MIATVTDAVLAAVARAAAEGDDPLGASRPSRVRPLVEEALDGADAALAARIAASLEARAGAVGTIGNPAGLSAMDPLLAALLAHVGVDPLVVAWLASHAGLVDLEDTDTGMLVARADGRLAAHDPSNAGSVRIGDAATFWFQPGRVTVAEMPESVLATIEGMPLARVLSHPALDPLGLSVVGCEDGDGVVEIVTSHTPRPATAAELLALGPCGCR